PPPATTGPGSRPRPPRPPWTWAGGSGPSASARGSGCARWASALGSATAPGAARAGRRPPPAAPALDLGGRLRAERLGQGIGLREMARRLGISASALSTIETRKAHPSVRELSHLHHLLGV